MTFGNRIRSHDLLKFGANQLDYYDGLLIKADKNLHAQMLTIVDAITKIYTPPKGQMKIFDIACGEGAFAKRLIDSGYYVECSDIDEQSFKFKNLCQFYRQNINALEFLTFSEMQRNKYDIVLSMETIEHIENPWQFIRGLQNMCKKGGYVIVSTPNIENPPSKSYFARTNKFQSFTEQSFREIGHINPMTEYEIRMISEQLQLEMIDVVGAGTHPIFWLTLDIKVCIPWTLSNILLFPFTNLRDYSSCKIYVMKKANEIL